MMLIKKIVLVAACVAMALGSTSASPVMTRVRSLKQTDYASPDISDSYDSTDSADSYDDSSLSSDSYDSYDSADSDVSDDASSLLQKTYWKDVCSGAGQSPMSVEGVQGVFCVTGQACVANIANGACPGPQDGLQYGASCGIVKTGVYGCKPNTAPPATAAPVATSCNGPNQSPMSVDGVEGVFCVTGLACVANIANGACPGPQTGLEHGASCGIVKTGVYGCKPNSSHKKHHHKSQGKIDCPGGSPMSVEGVEGVFCVTGRACVADIATGACPGPQNGLQYGASCGVVKTGVYGCKPNTAPPATAAPATTTCNGPNQSPMSVEGVEGVFCVTGQACVANISNGACPGPQTGLEHGASCGIVKTGVYGCKPNSSHKRHHHHH